MNKLEKYVSLYLETRAYTYPPESIDSNLQNKISPKLSNDKTHMTPEEVVDDMRDKWGDNYAISFVRGYKGQIPSVEINPYARFATPHAIYSYLLTKENLTNLFLSRRTPGIDFATDRPYFHIIRLSSHNKAVINPDMTSDYYSKIGNLDIDSTGPYSDQLRQEKYKKIILPKYLSDVREMLRVSLLSQITPNKTRNTVKQRGKTITVTRKNYMSILYSTGFRPNLIAKNIKLTHDILCTGSDEKTAYLNTFLNYVTSFLVNLVDRLFSSRKSRFYNSRVKKDDPDFLVAKIYRIADILSYITHNPKRGSGRHNDPARLSLILHSIGLDSVVDTGSRLVHEKQPQQALSINWGPNSSVENMGTYKNIFKYCSRKELKELFVNNADFLH